MQADQARDFARLERASDGRQVLVYKSTDDFGKPELRMVLEHLGLVVEFKVSFEDTEAGWVALDGVFDGVDADRVVQKVLGAVERGEL